jgi:chorismate synthase
MRGSAHNDPFVMKGERLGTSSNHSGGVQGGISNGEPIFFRVAFKPVPTIGREQATADFSGAPIIFYASTEEPEHLTMPAIGWNTATVKKGHIMPISE